MKLLVVESPAKSKTIEKYLGKDFVVVPSIGHVRDLAPVDGSVDVDNGFKMKWQVMEGKERQVKLISDRLRKADELYLATDPDREGEAISWHIIDILKERGELTKPARRVAFHEITKSAVQKALAEPRDIDAKLVDAYFARRALDYLVGFRLSPVLWRKLPGSKSAGRVQSVALRLIADREREIEAFKAREYWTIEGEFSANGKKFGARLTIFDGAKLDKFDIQNEAKAREILSRIGRDFTIVSIESKKQARKPAPPFTTSTLQQEASRKLGFSAKQAMQLAQRLYEGVDLGSETTGLITYMRTDSVNLSAEATAAMRDMISRDFGAAYLPKSEVRYEAKSKNAQEAHEAIRPTHPEKTPESIRDRLDAQQFKLYDLIWKRALASQMAPAELATTAVDLDDGRGSVFRANGSMVVFDGFMRLYREDVDDKDGGDDENKMLPSMEKGQPVPAQDIRPEQHFTQPPPRFGEASLVKRMEELGIGRPSTYASILSVIQERGYVHLDKKKFAPSDRGRIVSEFLEHYFPKYVEDDFTAFMEDRLDDISNGKVGYLEVLGDFWRGFKDAVDAGLELSNSDVTAYIDARLGGHFFPDGNRKCPECRDGALSIKLSRFGGFIGCSNYPECKYTKPLESLAAAKANSESSGPAQSDARSLGKDENGVGVFLKRGPYGDYVQLGENSSGGVRGPVRASVPRSVPVDGLTLEKALFLLSLPRDLGEGVSLHAGRFGPYVKRGDFIKNVPPSMDLFGVDLAAAEALLETASERPRARELGLHPADGKPVLFYEKGRYGPYVAHNRVFATVYPKELDSLDLGLAIEKLLKKEPAEIVKKMEELNKGGKPPAK
ncbi:MAG: type I DNA topoisomerase [Rickettsiales bacterium]|jgi:DNA topoisomerase-1|nr:type I DNA topoisomerase [Rickettsiales bacterium]